ncbi:MAG: CopG family antitoxin [Bryobacteraceae bacterium]
MRRQNLPDTDSIEELAKFWDTHDLTDFEEDLEEGGEAVFVRPKGASVSIDLQPADAQHLKEIARSKGVEEITLLQKWIAEKLHQASHSGRPNKALQPASQKNAPPLTTLDGLVSRCRQHRKFRLLLKRKYPL